MADLDHSNWHYDVFLSFRGEDTRQSFTGHLFHALQRLGINTFMDDDGLQGGDHISLSLVKAIEESRISIVVFSENYASSPWCLDELVKIVECVKMKNQLVWPIFYKVAPSDVRHQRNSYDEAMAEHENRLGNESEKLQKWRSALSQVANLKGWHFEKGYEYEFIQSIVKMAITKLHREQLDIGEHVIGLQSRLQEVKSLLDTESRKVVCMVGIYGIDGIGKTTLAKALYNLTFNQFECAIFVEGVRETSNNMGLIHLQEAILSKLLERKIIKLGSVDEGAARLKERLRHRRILLVLDDIDSVEQLEKLAGNCQWFGSGSRIIITTRHKHVLAVHEVLKRDEMKRLDDHEALQLFSLKAFKMSQPPTSYEAVSHRAVCYANGLPLALKEIGFDLFSKSVKECECALEQYERIPERKIQDILKGSSNVEGIILNPLRKEVEVEWSGFAFEKMNNLRFLTNLGGSIWLIQLLLTIVLSHYFADKPCPSLPNEFAGYQLIHHQPRETFIVFEDNLKYYFIFYDINRNLTDINFATFANRSVGHSWFRHDAPTIRSFNSTWADVLCPKSSLIGFPCTDRLHIFFHLPNLLASELDFGQAIPYPFSLSKFSLYVNVQVRSQDNPTGFLNQNNGFKPDFSFSTDCFVKPWDHYYPPRKVALADCLSCISDVETVNSTETGEPTAKTPGTYIIKENQALQKSYLLRSPGFLLPWVGLGVISFSVFKTILSSKLLLIERNK